ncbi:hypothetical protein BAnh1_09350 [Bartonella australis AUST/NH1]|uniref:Uncharacterized protein n=1 Tax=Bartonella australis (strain Aust/NH1) TaxID=1094489 RepID=M1NU20_BARAA|nr:hypothetical protein [Bartonella australis]AGF74808.1 hypothetical protein BAnh1_09350 [Bartonella australis AUST/NH1]
MKKIHKIISRFILLASAFAAFLLKAQMTDITVQTLMMFFFTTLIFYMISIAILYNSSYLKSVHKYVDKKLQKRGTYILKSYLLTSGRLSIFSITSIILFTAFATKDTSGVLNTKIPPLTVPLTNTALDLNLLLSSGLFGSAVLNIFYMLLLMNAIINGMVEEAKGKAA